MSLSIGDVIEPFDERLGTNQEPEILTLTEKKGFVPQREKFNKRVATADTSKYRVVRQNDIAFNPYLLWAGAIAMNRAYEKAIISPAYPTFRIRDGFDASYVDWVLSGDPIRLRYDSISFGAVPRRRRAAVKAFLSIEIGDAPPLAEQKRIAKILDAADALRAKRRESLAQLDALLQSTFLEMFGDPVENPNAWSKQPLAELANHFCDGPFGSNLKSSHYVDEGVRVLRLQNIGVGELLEDDLAFIAEDHFQSLSRNHCKPGDVIIGTLGDPNLRACVIPQHLERSLNKADCLLFRPNREDVLSSYVCWLLNCEALVDSAAGLIRGQTRGRISLGRLKTLAVPVPPIRLQQRFDAAVVSIQEQKKRLSSQAAELDSLFHALQQRAFSGAL